jgi:hypothetical protein
MRKILTKQMTFQDNPKFHPDKHHKRSPNRVG